jgi:hypothetical protein
MSNMHPLFEAILQILEPKPEPACRACGGDMNHYRGCMGPCVFIEPAPVRKLVSCNACLDTGETESGGACRWCALGDDWNGVIAGETDSD